MGLVVGAYSVSALLLRPWAGRLGDRRGRRPLMVLGAGLFGVSVLGYTTATDPAALAPLRLLTGAGEAFFFVGAVTAVSDLAPPDRRGEAMSLASLGLYVGIGVGPLLGEMLIERWGFTHAWLLAAACGFTALGVALRSRQTRPAVPPSASGAGSGAGAATGAPAGAIHRLVHPAGLLPGLLASILGMAGFLAFVPLYALDLGMGGSSGVLLLFAGVVVGIRTAGARIPDGLGQPGPPGWPWRCRRWGSRQPVPGARPGASWPARSCSGSGSPCSPHRCSRRAVEGVTAEDRGAVIGTASAFLDLAFGLGPALLGFVAAALGRPGTFLVGAGVAVAGLVLVMATGLGRSPVQPHGGAVPADAHGSAP